MAVAVICEKYGWTWYEYHSQPIEFITLIKEKLRIDSHKASEAHRKSHK